MARKALKVREKKLKARLIKALAAGKKPYRPTQVYNRCALCGRIGGYMSRFDMCRICFRELASRGMIPGVKKSSW